MKENNYRLIECLCCHYSDSVLTHAGFFGVSNEVVRAEAAIGSVVIDALGVGAARRRTHHAFVDVCGRGKRVSEEF